MTGRVANAQARFRIAVGRAGALMKRRILLGNSNPLSDLATVMLALADVGHLTEGQALLRFERMFAAQLGAGRACSFFAGRVALAAILDAIDIRAGDEVIIPAYTCVAVPNPILALGATPVYADIDRRTGNLCPHSVARVVSNKTRALLVQHTFGIPAAIAELNAVAREHSLRVIEDCTHAFGANYAGQPVGTHGDAAFFSMEQSKILSTGSGGIAYSANPEIARRLADYQSRSSFPPALVTWKMLCYLVDIILLGGPLYNSLTDTLSYYMKRTGLAHGPVTTDEEMACVTPVGILTRRLPNGLAKIGISQLARFEKNRQRRQCISEQYAAAVERLRIPTLSIPASAAPNMVRFPIVVADKAEIIRYMRAQAVAVGDWFSAPVHPRAVDQAAAGYRAGSCPEAEWAVAHIANLPITPRMSDADVQRVVNLLETFQGMARTKADEFAVAWP